LLQVKIQFTIEEGMEDVHFQVEALLTRRIGETGKNSLTDAARSGGGG